MKRRARKRKRGWKRRKWQRHAICGIEHAIYRNRVGKDTI